VRRGGSVTLDEPGVGTGPTEGTASTSPSRVPPPLRLTRSQWDGLLLYGSFFIVVVFTFCFSTDDPFITLRYAANIVHGHGVVFNPGQRVEGYTSPLHLLLMTGVYLLPGGHALLKAKLVSLLFGVLTLVAARRLLRVVELPPWGVTVGALLVGGSWAMAVSAANGLETTLACLFTTLLVAQLVSGGGIRKPVVAGLVSAGLVATRPEGFVVAVALAVASLALESRSVPRIRRCLWFAGALAMQVLIELVRLAYYGQLLPNTYFAKHEAASTALRNGLHYLWSLEPGVPKPLYVAALSVFVAGAWTLARSSILRKLYLLVAIGSQVLVVLGTGGDWMLGDRFFAPVLPLTAVVLTIGTVTLLDAARRHHPFGSRAVHVAWCAALGCVLGLCAVLPIVRYDDPIWRSGWSFDDASLVTAGGFVEFSGQLWPGGLAMLRCVPSGSLVAYSEIGYAGFERQDLRFLDTRGLTDTAIADHAPAGDKDAKGVTDDNWTSPDSVVGARILALRPSIVLSFDWRSGPPHTVLGGAYVEVKDRSTYAWDGSTLDREDLAMYARESLFHQGPVASCAGGGRRS
jgi:arabinofuranosyltransferase